MKYIFLKNAIKSKKNLIKFFLMQLFLIITYIAINGSTIIFLELSDYISFLGLGSINGATIFYALIKVIGYLIIIYAIIKVFTDNIVSSIEYIMLRSNNKKFILLEILNLVIYVFIMRTIINTTVAICFTIFNSSIPYTDYFYVYLKDILFFLICIFNIMGLMLVMNDGLQVLEVYKDLDIKKKIISFICISFITFLVYYTNIDLVFFLIIEYFCILVYNKQKKRSFSLRGINSILFVLLTEFVIGMLFYYRNISLNNDEMQMITYLATAIIEFFWVTFHKLKKVGKGFKKLMMIILELIALENLIWLIICISTSLFESAYITMIILFIFTIILCYIALYIVSNKLLERSKIDNHSNTYEYYLQMEEEHRQIRKMYHDMKNQLMIQAENEQNFMNQYLQESSKKLDDLHQFYQTGFHSLDILLFDSKIKAKEKGIEFEAVISQGCLSFMKEEDINIIFNNAIVNALEACEKIPDEGLKSIKIKAGKNLDDTLIYVKNTVNKKQGKGSLHTYKKNKKLHGIGMTSIQESVEKYKGYISIIEEEDIFQLAILFTGEQ